MKPAFAALLLVCLILSSSMFEITALGVEILPYSETGFVKLLLHEEMVVTNPKRVGEEDEPRASYNWRIRSLQRYNELDEDEQLHVWGGSWRRR
ncbi:unnamed protein product [Vicia faba]|uniref:Uncharacterized protein n=1 Tax=Vicia faba TaxID=3906 RepID=A0AAV0YPR7_VICFA|nr:unnamed protein product [Vicia faba]